MSFSRPDPSSPASIADASFGTGRRGFDQGEVREFLRMVAAELGRLQERERFLERELREALDNPDLSSAKLDDAALTRLLGEETARVLGTAREAANEIREKAEGAAGRMLAEASDEARRLREEAELESSRRRADAAADAEAELDMAKQQGREMVNEARAYRERVLSELARRRELAREQIEQLIHGRDRLMQAFERARLVAVDVVSEMQPLGEPDEYVNLAPTTGPVPVMVANSARPDERPPATDAPADSSADAEAGEGAADDAAAEDRSDEPPDGDAAVVADDGADSGVVDAGDAGTDSGAGDAADADDGADSATADVAGHTNDQEVDHPAGDEDDSAPAERTDDPSDRAHDGAAPADRVAGGEEPDHPSDGHGTDGGRDDGPADQGAGTSPVGVGAADVDRKIDTGRAADGARTDESGPATADTGEDDDVVVDLFARIRAGAEGAAAAADVQDADDGSDGAVSDTGPGDVDSGDVASDAGPDDGDPAIWTATVGEDTGPADAAGRETGHRGRGETTGATGDDDEGDPAIWAATVGADEPTPFERRDEDLTPLIVSSARKLKRILADEQNGVLDALRRHDPVRRIDTLLPPADDQVARYADAIADDLLVAAHAGAASVPSGRVAKLKKSAAGDATGAAREVLREWLVAPLRDRLDRCVSEGDGDNEVITKKVRAAYREWKTQHIDEQLDDVLLCAHGRGVLAALDAGTPVTWTVDERRGSCPDCDDNALAGVVDAGAPFPTGHTFAPAHPGCRCLLLPVDR